MSYVSPYLLLPIRSEHQAALEIAKRRWERADHTFRRAQEELDASEETEI